VEASTTPPMMGSSTSSTGRLGLSFRNMAESSTAQTDGGNSTRTDEDQQGVKRAPRDQRDPGMEG
jgi:hypothetical protein